jgi:hypothetical protein
MHCAGDTPPTSAPTHLEVRTVSLHLSWILGGVSLEPEDFFVALPAPKCGRMRDLTYLDSFTIDDIVRLFVIHVSRIFNAIFIIVDLILCE